MTDEITFDELRRMAMQAGLKLADEELQKLLPGVNRSRKQVAELRELIPDIAEPASVFSALKANKA
jgi:Ca2+-binding EF-hand superfamily protein